jgi:hypothetical protein
MKELFLTALTFFSLTAGYSQTTLTGYQFKRQEKDAVLECEGLKITRTMLIDSVQCDCDGFWIMKGAKGDKPVKAFWRKRVLHSAIGFELKPDTYFIYPNLKEDSDSASVTIFVKYKLLKK